MCLDMEGVLVPEIWIGVAARTGIEALRLTTRDVPDYDALMRGRIKVLLEHDLRISDIRAVIGELEPFEGVDDFLGWLRERFQVVILSDTFYEFATPLMRKLGWPTLMCNELDIDESGCITGHRLRQPDQKREAVKALLAGQADAVKEASPSGPRFEGSQPGPSLRVNQNCKWSAAP